MLWQSRRVGAVTSRGTLLPLVLRELVEVARLLRDVLLLLGQTIRLTRRAGQVALRTALLRLLQLTRGLLHLLQRVLRLCAAVALAVLTLFHPVCAGLAADLPSSVDLRPQFEKWELARSLQRDRPTCSATPM